MPYSVRLHGGPEDGKEIVHADERGSCIMFVETLADAAYLMLNAHADMFPIALGRELTYRIPDLQSRDAYYVPAICFGVTRNGVVRGFDVMRMTRSGRKFARIQAEDGSQTCDVPLDDIYANESVAMRAFAGTHRKA